MWGIGTPTAQQNESIHLTQNYSLMKMQIKNMKGVKMTPL